MLYYLYVFVSAVLMALSTGALLLWFNRRSEVSLLALAASGIAASALAILLVLNPALTAPWGTSLLATALIALLFSLCSYAIASFKAAPARRLLAIAGITSGLGLLAVWGSASLAQHEMVVTAAVLLNAVLLGGLVAYSFLGSQRLANPLAAGGILLAAAAAAWDQSSATFYPAGAAIKITPFVLLCLLSYLFGLAIYSFMHRLSDQEKLAQQLGERIEKTKANLLASESARRSLEVSSAITHERERMMREIHDGIGSSLMAAIASAERQGRQTSTAIVALKSALTDLRIAVDSLEPVEGNVATLLASLRYRLEPEMRRLGISVDWRVGDVPELDWLDASNALHVLRIFQEAIGNILGHANANVIRFECRLDLYEGRPGIRIEVEDNGVGFDPSIASQGKGRRNIAERAAALEAKLWVDSAPGAGTKTTLWLPLLRSGNTGGAAG